MSLKNLCVYCGSRTGSLEQFSEDARLLGLLLARHQINLIYGGGNCGLMGLVASATLEQGGTVTGVIPHALVDRELAHGGVTRLIRVPDMHTRKRVMADESDAFVALPGGIGTMDEFFEILTWQQLSIHAKPCAILNSAGYYDRFIEFLNHMVQHDFLHQDQLDRLIISPDPKHLIQSLAAS